MVSHRSHLHSWLTSHQRVCLECHTIAMIVWHCAHPPKTVACTKSAFSCAVSFWKLIKCGGQISGEKMRCPLHLTFAFSNFLQLLMFLTIDPSLSDHFRLAQPLFEDFKLKWGLKSYVLSKPSDSIYPASSALDIPQYVEHGPDLLDTDYDVSEENYVQYAPRKGEERAEDDFESFFGGNLYRDRTVGSKGPLIISRL